MKIACQSCQAKYTIADDKVAGKVVKIRCKKCAATIVVNGTDSALAADSASAPHPSEGAAQEWTINVADGDQRTMAEEEVVAAYRSGVVDGETYCWRETMADWTPLREIPDLLAACTAAVESVVSLPSVSEGDEAAAGAPAMPAFPAVDGPLEADRASARSANAAPAVAAPVAARRAGGGRAPIADLFGGVAQAGGEDDIMTSARLPGPPGSDDPQRLTGARNENSVLFSLSTLTGKSDRAPKPPDPEGSGLIDIRQLSAQIGGADEGKKSSRVDDIMNLSGGGFSPALTAPALLAPTIEPYAESRAAAPSSRVPAMAKNRGLVVLALGVGALVIVVAVGGAMSMMHKSAGDTAKATPSASAEEAPPARPAAAAASAVAPDTKASAATAPEATVTAAQAPPAAQASSEPAASPPPAAPPERREPRLAAKEMAPPARAVAPAVSDQPFNMGEARARLGATAEGVQPCKRGDVTGTGHVLVTFAPNGSVQSVAIDGAPFEGTSAGACVAAHFRTVRVSPFAGGPFKVRKSFTIN